MDPLSLIAGAVAAGAAASAGEVAKQVVVDAYAALKRILSGRYAEAAADVAGVESDPEEPLRRQLLAKQLGKSGASTDEELQAAAQEVLCQVAEHASEAATRVGVSLNRVATGNDIEISDIAVQGGSGVTATDVSAGGSLTIRGVKVENSEPPHPPLAR